MKLKNTSVAKENRKSSQGRLSLKIPLSSRKSLLSGRLSIPYKKESISRPSLTTIQSRPSLPVKSRNLAQFQLPFKKQYIIENLMKKLDDEQQLKSIIQSKYLAMDQLSTTAPFSTIKSQINNSSRCSNCSNIKTSMQYRPSLIKRPQKYFQQQKSRYLKQKLRNCQQQMIFLKQSNAQLTQNTKLLYQQIMNRNDDNYIITMKKLKNHKNNNQFEFLQNYNKPIIKEKTNQVKYSSKTFKQNEQYVSINSRQNFLNNLDCTLNILRGVSTTGVR